MPPHAPELDLLAVERGSVTAPAGCGKTQLITDTLASLNATKPALVLTHTNAGVRSLHSRLTHQRVPSQHYRLSTLDGLALRIARTFPVLGDIDPSTLELQNPGRDYPAIQQAALRIVRIPGVADILRSTYSCVLVDEYQDCSALQHSFVVELSQTIQCIVVGDPMQSIFKFRGPIVDWNSEVVPAFPEIGQLTRPWRWERAGQPELGHWLLFARGELAAGRSLDLLAAPTQVKWVRTAAATEFEQQCEASRTESPVAGGRVLIVCDSVNRSAQQETARRTHGASTVERVSLDELIDFGATFEPEAEESLDVLLQFAAELMTGVSREGFMKRIRSLQGNRAIKPATPAEDAALHYCQSPSFLSASILLSALKDEPESRVFRPMLHRLALSALRAAHESGRGLHDAVVDARERNRNLTVPLPKRAVGSTLLLKGLEAEVVVVHNPERMDAHHLYVALTRGSHRVVVTSETSTLVPKATGRARRF